MIRSLIATYQESPQKAQVLVTGSGLGEGANVEGAGGLSAALDKQAVSRIRGKIIMKKWTRMGFSSLMPPVINLDKLYRISRLIQFSVYPQNRGVRTRAPDPLRVSAGDLFRFVATGTQSGNHLHCDRQGERAHVSALLQFV